MLGAGTQAVEPGAAILSARRGEGGAGQLLGIEAESRLLRRVAPLRKRAGHGLGGEMIAEAGHVTLVRHRIPVTPDGPGAQYTILRSDARGASRTGPMAGVQAAVVARRQ